MACDNSFSPWVQLIEERMFTLIGNIFEEWEGKEDFVHNLA